MCKVHHINWHGHIKLSFNTALVSIFTAMTVLYFQQIKTQFMSEFFNTSYNTNKIGHMAMKHGPILPIWVLSLVQSWTHNLSQIMHFFSDTLQLYLNNETTTLLTMF